MSVAPLHIILFQFKAEAFQLKVITRTQPHYRKNYRKWIILPNSQRGNCQKITHAKCFTSYLISYYCSVTSANFLGTILGVQQDERFDSVSVMTAEAGLQGNYFFLIWIKTTRSNRPFLRKTVEARNQTSERKLTFHAPLLKLCDDLSFSWNYTFKSRYI